MDLIYNLAHFPIVILMSVNKEDYCQVRDWIIEEAQDPRGLKPQRWYGCPEPGYKIESCILTPT